MKTRKFKFNKSVPSLILKEIKSILFSPTGFIVGSLFIFVVGILVFGIGRFTQFGTNDLTQVFGYLAFAMAIAIPALVMGSISKEKGNGTMEYLLSKPLSEFEILLAKFISYSILSVLLILLTLPLTLATAAYAGVDVGQVFMQYAGAIMLAVSIVSVGIAVSALFKNEVASFLTTVVIVALFIITGSNLINFLPFSLSTFLDRISLLSHYQSVSRGVLDLRDLFYFAAFIFLFLSVAYFLLIKDKYPSKHKYLRNTKIATVLFVIIAFLVGTLGQVIPGRLDFTSDQRYTLSPATVNVLNNIQDTLTIDYYASSNLPIEFQSELRRVSDLLTDYAKASNGRIILNTREPDKDQTIQSQAEAAGITQIRFSVNSSDSAQVVVGYFGIAFKYQDKNEAMNLDNSILNDLEYQVTKKVKKLTEISKKVVAFVNNNVLHSLSGDLTRLNSELGDLFEVRNIELTLENPEVPSDISAIVIAGPVERFSDKTIESLKAFFNNGGSIFFLTDTIDTNTETPTINENALGNLFADYGVTINNDLVYDLDSNNIVALQSLFSPVIFNFPQWIISRPVDSSTGITKDVSAVSLLWANSINIEQKENVTASVLLTTSENSNIQSSDSLNTTFEQTWEYKDSDSTRTVGVALENSKGGRAVIVADTDFITDNILSALAERQAQDKEVISFTLNSISWLVRDSLVGSIKAKTNSAKLLNLNSNQQVTYIAASVGIPILICTLVFAGYYLKRRRTLNKIYKSNE